MRKTNLDDVPILFETLKEMSKNWRGKINDSRVSSLIEKTINGDGRIIDENNFIFFKTHEQYYDNSYVMSFEVSIVDFIYSSKENAKILISQVEKEINKIYVKEHLHDRMTQCCGLRYHYGFTYDEDLFNEKAIILDSFNYKMYKNNIIANEANWEMIKWLPNMEYYNENDKS